MKTIFRIIGAAVLVAGCMAEMEQKSPVNDGASSVLVLSGQTGDIDSKIAIGDQSGGKVPVNWTADDALGVYSLEDDADMYNTQAILKSGAGENKGSFATVDSFTLAEGENDLFIYYPYNFSPITSGDIIQIPVPSTQNSSNQVGTYSVGYAKTTAEADEPVSFNMEYANAFIKLTVSSTDYSSYLFRGVTLRDLTGEKNISGAVNLDMASGTSSVAEEGKPYLKYVIDEPVALSSAQTVYISALPADFTSTPLYFAIELFDEETKTTVTIPVAKNGRLVANGLSEVVIENLSEDDNDIDWYEPVEMRDLVGGYAYGPENTVRVSWQGEAQTIDVKARGDFAMVKKPSKAKILWSDVHSSSSYVQLNGQDAKDAAVALGDGYTISLKNRATGGTRCAMGKVGILDEEGNTLWAVAMWLTDNNVDSKAQTYACGAVVMDRNLGAQVAYRNDKYANGGVYYQWGRPVPFGWSKSGLVGLDASGKTQESAYNVKATTAGNFPLSVILSMPMSLFAPDSQFAATANHDWYFGNGNVTGSLDDLKNDFWGNPEGGDWQSGQKTIYDPCPKGWRVASPDVIEEAFTATSSDTEEGTYKYFSYGSEESKVYYPYSGGWYLYKSAGNNNIAKTPSNADYYALCWTNAPVEGTYEAKAFIKKGPQEDENAKEEGIGQDVANSMLGARANAFPVRCMKDNDNR